MSKASEKEFYDSLEEDLSYAIKKFYFLTKKGKKRNNRAIQKMYLALIFKIDEIKENETRKKYNLELKKIIDENDLRGA